MSSLIPWFGCAIVIITALSYLYIQKKSTGGIFPERKDSEQSLNESYLLSGEESCSQILEYLSEGMVVCRLIYDKSGNAVDYIVTRISPNFESIIGLKEKDVVGKRVTDILNVDDAPLIDMSVKVVETNATSKSEIYLEQFKKHFKVALFATGVNEFAAIFSDITEQKCARKELQESEDRYRRLIDCSPYGIAVIDDKTILFANQAAAKLMGLSSSNELIGTSFLDFVNDSNRSDYSKKINELRNLLEDKDIDSVVVGLTDEKLTTVDGREITASIMMTAIRYNGQPALQMIMRDITDKKRTQQELEFKSILLDQVNDSIFAVNSLGQFVYLNEAAYKSRGYTEEELMSMTLQEIAVFNEQSSSADNGSFDPRQSKIYNTMHCGKDGIAMDVEVHESTVEIDGDAIKIAVTRDISERKLIEEALKESERQFRGLLENMQLISVMLDTEGIITFCNDFLLNLTGWDWLDLIGRDWFEILVPIENRKQVKLGFKKAIDSKTKTTNSEYDILTANGEFRTISFSWSLLHDPQGSVSGMAYIGEDITERKRIEAELNHMAYYDPLTSLPNRTLFIDRLDKAMTQADRNKESIAIFHLDLDGFKIINDSFGHDKGDKLLKHVSDRLIGSVGDQCLIARFSGDEFILMLTGLSSANDATVFAEKAIDIFKDPFMIDECELHVTACMGANIYPGGGSDAHALLKNVEVALYSAKDRGRSIYQLYSSALDTKSFERLLLENNLRKALSRKELELYYQPQVSLVTGEIVGMEALLRWNSEEHGMVSPVIFIPIAEETGLILSIGEWVLREACGQAKAWIDAGFAPIRMSVNLSARQFQHHNLVGMVDRILFETQLAPELLDLELTESTVMKDADKAIEVLNEIKKRGIHISIDDFGTGYSSLGYLKRFPVDRLKVDRMFIDSVITDENDAAIVSATIAMAKSLKMWSVAEGVETEEQLAFLQSLECNEMQGYLFSKPLPVDAATKTLGNPPNHLDGYWRVKDSKIA